MNSDGLVSFHEYIFCTTIMAIPEGKFKVVFDMFDLDGNSELDQEEFCKLMEVHNWPIRSRCENRAQQSEKKNISPPAFCCPLIRLSGANDSQVFRTKSRVGAAARSGVVSASNAVRRNKEVRDKP